jgi:hypothetical protein
MENEKDWKVASEDDILENKQTFLCMKTLHALLREFWKA